MIPEQLPARGSFLDPLHTVSSFEIRPDGRRDTLQTVAARARGLRAARPVGYRVLIVMLGLLGDMLIASPLPARIRADHPGARITGLSMLPARRCCG